MSDSTLASSSLSKRVVQIRSLRGKRADSYSAKSQLSTGIQYTPTSNGQPNGVHSSSAGHLSYKPRLPWFHSESSSARGRDLKYHTPTITEEPAVLRSISPPRASPMTPRSPAVDFKVWGPRMPVPRGYPSVYPERPSSPDSSTVSSISGFSRTSSQVETSSAILTRRPDPYHKRLVPRPPVLATSPPPLPPKLCNGRSDNAHPQQIHTHNTCSNEQDPAWVVYGYV